MAKSTVSLRVFGDDLDPPTISRLLGCEPDQSYRKGDLVSPGRSTTTRKCGMWSLKAQETDPENYEAQLRDILSKVTQNGETWRALRERYEVDLFCGFPLDTTNHGFSLSTSTIEALAARGIEPGFDIYAPSPEEESEYWARQDSPNVA